MPFVLRAKRNFPRDAALLSIFVLILCAWAGPAWAACTSGKSYDVHLTFDDGPSPDLVTKKGVRQPGRTSRILDTLKTKGVTATFFVMGSKISSKTKLENKEGLLARIKAEGHTLASHTYEHKSHTCGGRLAPYFKPEDALKDLDRARGGRDDLFTSKLFRFPYGRGWLFEPKCPGLRVPVMDHAHKLGMQHLGWDIDSQDYMTNPPFFKSKASVIPGILNQICRSRGGVVLMHDINPWTARHLGEVIDAIRAAGHRLTGLDKISKDHESFDQAPNGPHAELPDADEESTVR